MSGPYGALLPMRILGKLSTDRMGALFVRFAYSQNVYHPKYTAINIFMKLKYNNLITVTDQENEPHLLAQKLNFDVDYKKRGRCGNV